MSVGDIKWFAQALHNLGTKQFDLNNDAIKVGIINNSVVPTIDTPDPHWGGVGTTNFASTQVAVGTTYTGPITLTSKTWSLQQGGPNLRAAIIDLPQDVSAGFINGAYAIFYDDTDSKKRALGFLEMSAAGGISLVTGPVKLDWNGATDDILLLKQA